MPERKTIWLQERAPGDPLQFAGGKDGQEHHLVITGVSADKASGYLQMRG
jgi:hypothetical protein